MTTEIRPKNGKIKTIHSLDEFVAILRLGSLHGIFITTAICDCEVRQGNGEWMPITEILRALLIENDGSIAKILAAEQGKADAEQESEQEKAREQSEAKAAWLAQMAGFIEDNWSAVAWDDLESVLEVCCELLAHEHDYTLPKEREAAESLLYAVIKNPQLPAILNTRMMSRLNTTIMEISSVARSVIASNAQIESTIRSGNQTKGLAAGAGLLMASQMLGEMRDSNG